MRPGCHRELDIASEKFLPSAHTARRSVVCCLLVSWQEDLRRIDADLAAGKLSKEQYAVKREELLAEASSATPGTAGQEAQRPADAAPKGSRQVPAKDLLTTDRPTTAPSPADENSTDSMPHPRPQPVQQPVAVQPGDVPPPVPAARPYRINDLPPREPPPHDQHNGAALTWLFLGLGLLLVVGLIAAGVWWLAVDDSDDSAAPPPAPTSDPAGSPPPTTTTGKPELIDRLPELPGVLNRNSGTFSAAEGAERKLYGNDEALLLEQQGVEKVTWKGSSRRAGKAEMAYVVLVAHNASARKAESTAKALRSLSKSRVPAAEGLPGYKQLPTFRRISEQSNVYRVIYTSGSRTVRVGVVQSPGTDAKRLTAELTDLLKQITAELPPSGG